MRPYTRTWRNCCVNTAATNKLDESQAKNAVEKVIRSEQRTERLAGETGNLTSATVKQFIDNVFGKHEI